MPPALEAAPLHVASAVALCIALSVYLAWVVDSWSIIVHAAFLPVEFGLFFAGYQRLVADDFVMVGEAPSDAAAGVLKRALLRVPPAARYWLVAGLLLLAYQGLLLAVVVKSFWWIGWSIGLGLVVLAATFLSNRYWFGTLKFGSEQPILCTTVLLAIWAWAALGWIEWGGHPGWFFSAPVSYPVLYADIFAVQLVRDVGWSLQDARPDRPDAAKASARLFVKRAAMATLAFYVYLVALGAITYSFGLALVGVAALVAFAFTGLVLWRALVTGAFRSRRLRIALFVTNVVCTSLVAIGVTIIMQSIFGGFTVLCGGALLACGGGGAIRYLEVGRRFRWQRVSVASDLVLPIFTLNAGRAEPSHSGLLLALAALGIVAAWGLAAAAAWREHRYLGASVGVLALVAAFLLLCRAAVLGRDVERAARELPEADLQKAVQGVLDVFTDKPRTDDLDPGAAASAASAAAPAAAALGSAPDLGGAAVGKRRTLAGVSSELQALLARAETAHRDFEEAAAEASHGRFHYLPAVSIWHCCGDLLSRRGDSARRALMPRQLKELESKVELWREAVESHQEFQATVQLCLIEAHRQWLSSSEASFARFLEGLGQGALGGGLRKDAFAGFTAKDFKLCDAATQRQLREAYEAWDRHQQQLKAEQLARDRENAERARQRQADLEQRRQQARDAVAKALTAAKADPGRREDLERAVALAKSAGVSSQSWQVKEATAFLAKDPAPVVPVAPVAPVAPADPVDPVVPVAPVAPAAPAVDPEPGKGHGGKGAATGGGKSPARGSVVEVDAAKLKAGLKDGKYTDPDFCTLEQMCKSERKAATDVKRFSEMQQAGTKVQLFSTPLPPRAKAKGGAGDLRLDVKAKGGAASPAPAATELKQGCLGDCWFIAALQCTAQSGHLKKAFVMDRCQPEQGLYVVRFCKDGVWIEVDVDDWFPADCRSRSARVAFARATVDGVAWPSVIEKAYAKLHGSYDAIVGGMVSHALVDLTGGLGDSLQLDDEEIVAEISDGRLWKRLRDFAASEHLLGCGSAAGSDTDTVEGIVQGHAYSILRVEEVDGHRLLQLRNPWGRTEWTGKWSDSDEKSWTKRMKAKLGIDGEDGKADGGNDGVFWMAFEDFLKRYRSIYICRVFDDTSWKSSECEGRWEGKTAGGCSSNRTTFKDNPHFHLKLKGPTKLLVVLSQADSRVGSTGKDDREKFCIGFRIYQPSAAGSGGHERVVLSSGTFTNSLQVFAEGELAPHAKGPFAVVPSTYRPREETSFRLKVLWQGPGNAVQLSEWQPSTAAGGTE